MRGKLPLTLSNVGTTDLQIDALQMADATLSMVTAAGDPLAPLAWVLAPGAVQDIDVVYTPQGNVGMVDDLLVASSDPIAPTTGVSLSGDGFIEGENTIYWDVIGKENITILICLNLDMLWYSFETQFEDSLPVFFDTLLDSSAHFRIAALIAWDGTVRGSTAYIDESFSAAAASIVMDDMIGTEWEDNDAQLQTLLRGIDQNDDWLLNDGDEWADSKLSLVAINNDGEQSPGDGDYFVGEYQAYKEDPADIAVHAIGGDTPGGCSWGSGSTAWDFRPSGCGKSGVA